MVHGFALGGFTNALTLFAFGFVDLHESEQEHFVCVFVFEELQVHYHDFGGVFLVGYCADVS